MSKKPPHLSDDERDEFRRAMQGVSSLKSGTKRHHEKAKVPIRRRPNSLDHDEAVIPPTLENLPKERWVAGHETIDFTRGGLQHRLLSKFKRGAMPPEATLDLHRHTVDEALRKTDRFIKQCRQQDLRVIYIVHGKGHFSVNGKPMIKNALNQYLRQQPYVLAFSSAQPRHGGAGAVYVLLKSA